MLNVIKNFFSRIFDEVQSLKAWDRCALFYHNFVSPSCPSVQNLAAYKKWLPSGPDKTILVLGVTPQLRGLLGDFEGKIILADFSKKMYEATRSRISGELLAKEQFIWLNWLNISKALPANSVDCVLGDFVMVNVRPQDKEKFLDNVRAILKPSGTFITRIKIYNPFWRNVKPLYIIRKEINDPNFLKYRTSRYLLYRFGDKILNLVDFSFQSRDFIPLFEDAISETSDDIERRNIMFFLNNYKAINMVRTYFSEPAFELLVKTRFKISGVERADDYEESEFCPIYILKNH